MLWKETKIYKKVFKKRVITFASYVLQLYCPFGISPMGDLGCFPQGKPAATEPRYPPTCCACWVFQCFHSAPNSDLDYRIFNLHTDTDACECTGWPDGVGRGWVTDTIRESALKVELGRNPLLLCGIEPALAACWSDFYQLSYIPIP